MLLAGHQVAGRAASCDLGSPDPCQFSYYSPFFLVYGSEVVLPSDLAFGAPRI
jgi:hypothetical protein